MRRRDFVGRADLATDGAGGRLSEGRRLLLEMIQSGTSGRAIADAVGVTPQAISLIAIGAQSPNPIVIYSLEDLFGFPPRVWFQHPKARSKSTVIRAPDGKLKSVDGETATGTPNDPRAA